MPTPVDQASEEIALLIKELASLSRSPQVMSLLQRMSQLEADQFETFKTQMQSNIALQEQAQQMALAPAQALAGGQFLSPDVMNRLVEPLQAGQFISPQVQDTINRLASEQITLGTADIDKQFDLALQQARQQALGRNVLDVSRDTGMLSSPASFMFDRALEERTKQMGQLTGNVRGQSLASQLQVGLQLQQLLAGGLGEAFRQGVGGKEAQQRAAAPFFNIAQQGYYPSFPQFAPTPLGYVTQQPNFGQQGFGQPGFLATMGAQATSAGINPLITAGLRAMGLSI